MMKKRCLFCDEIVPTKSESNYDRYIGCSCSPGGYYSLRSDSYEAIQSFTHQKKREMFHLISAYIRERTDSDDKVTLTVNDLESIANSPEIPLTLEDKGHRLLQYLYRHAGNPGESVVIHPLSSNYNLTYSPNLQELVYIIDKLRNEHLLVREGINFQLTEKGWSEAAAIGGGKKRTPCSVLLPDQEELRSEWLGGLLPKIEKYGYQPRVVTLSGAKNGEEEFSLERISESKLMIADLTGQSSEVYFAAGYAFGLNIPIIWTVHSSGAHIQLPGIEEIRPIVWESVEELAVILQHKLG
ncbi:hypothetical protein LBW89_19655 [Paenibacillus sp. alder61]|uniref:hypothetical protein n=1 Tax=Paenibacillus sp. alder61 TaxID=2862948 RepID=UPI001CD51E4C|nr:hypothetical protein [Paenibacillus sp. alder61]MCA1295231.1 hypothetical protein [Paenibacillus sp. alder61]